MSIRVPADVIQQLRAATGPAELVGPSGESITVVRQAEQSWLDRLPPGIAFPPGVIPDLEPGELGSESRDGDMTSEQLWQHLESLPCTK